MFWEIFVLVNVGTKMMGIVIENENVGLYLHTPVSTLVRTQVCKHVRPYACAYIWTDINADGWTDERHMYIL